MKKIIRDLVALSGVGSLFGGVWLEYGLGVGLIVVGFLLIAIAVIPAWIGRG